MPDRIEVAAHILYAAFHQGQYSPRWSTAGGKEKWRDAAKALLRAFDDGII